MKCIVRMCSERAPSRTEVSKILKPLEFEPPAGRPGSTTRVSSSSGRTRVCGFSEWTGLPRRTKNGGFLCYKNVYGMSHPSQRSSIDTAILSQLVVLSCPGVLTSLAPIAWQERPREMPHGPTCGRHPSGQAVSALAMQQLMGRPGIRPTAWTRME